MHRRGHRRQACRRPASARLGRLSRTAAARHTGLDAVEWASEDGRLRRGRDPADQHGPRRHARSASTCALTRAVSRRGRRAGDRLGRRGHPASTWSKASSTAGADAVLAASIFHYGEHTVGEAKALMASRGIQCGCEGAGRAKPPVSVSPRCTTPPRGAHHRRPVETQQAAGGDNVPTACAPRPTACARPCFSLLGNSPRGLVLPMRSRAAASGSRPRRGGASSDAA